MRPSIRQSASLTSSQRQSALMIAMPTGEFAKPRRKRSSLTRRSAPRCRANRPERDAAAHDDEPAARERVRDDGVGLVDGERDQHAAVHDGDDRDEQDASRCAPAANA